MCVCVCSRSTWAPLPSPLFSPTMLAFSRFLWIDSTTQALPHADVIYFCSPNNPTGAVASREQLEALVAHANETVRGFLDGWHGGQSCVCCVCFVHNANEHSTFEVVLYQCV